MLDLAVYEQIDRLLWVVLIGLLVVPAWRVVVLIGRRRGLLWAVLEIAAQIVLLAAAAAAIGLGTNLQVRAYVFVGLGAGILIAVALLRGFRPPWKEIGRRRRT